MQARRAKALRASVSRRPCTIKKETHGETPGVQQSSNYWQSFALIRRIVNARFASDLRRHSFTRTTDHPRSRRDAATLRSRRLLDVIFCRQKRVRVFDNRLQRHPCQKQPSTKTASRFSKNTKSGFPGNVPQFIFHPEIPAPTKQARSRLSVVFPFWDLTNAIIRERACLVTLSTVF